jgi:hypothetical protein
METEIPCALAWKQPFPTGGHGTGKESISKKYAGKKVAYPRKVLGITIRTEKCHVDSTRICNQGCKSPIMEFGEM